MGVIPAFPVLGRQRWWWWGGIAPGKLGLQSEILFLKKNGKRRKKEGGGKCIRERERNKKKLISSFQLEAF